MLAIDSVSFQLFFDVTTNTRPGTKVTFLLGASASDPNATIGPSERTAFNSSAQAGSGRDDAAGDAVSRVTGGIAHIVIDTGVNHEGGAILVK
jgi:hypothetical protein